MNAFTVEELRRAVEGDELVLLYHPQVEMRTGQAVAVEAGVPWHHPKRGLLPALAFVDPGPPAGVAPAVMEGVLLASGRPMAEGKGAGVRRRRGTVDTWA